MPLSDDVPLGLLSETDRQGGTILRGFIYTVWNWRCGDGHIEEPRSDTVLLFQGLGE